MGSELAEQRYQKPERGYKKKTERRCQKPERGHIRQNHPFTKPPFFSGTQSTVAGVRLQGNAWLTVLWGSFWCTQSTVEMPLKRYGLEGFPSHSSDCSGGPFPAVLRGQPTFTKPPPCVPVSPYPLNLGVIFHPLNLGGSVKPKVRLQGYGYNPFCSHSSRCLAVLV